MTCLIARGCVRIAFAIAIATCIGCSTNRSPTHLDETSNDLWVLTHRDSRHLRRVATVFTHLAQAIVLP